MPLCGVCAAAMEADASLILCGSCGRLVRGCALCAPAWHTWNLRRLPKAACALHLPPCYPPCHLRHGVYSVCACTPDPLRE